MPTVEKILVFIHIPEPTPHVLFCVTPSVLMFLSCHFSYSLYIIIRSSKTVQRFDLYIT